MIRHELSLPPSGAPCRLSFALARALAPRPPILLLDEPLTNVEPELRERLAALIVAEAAASGATAIHVTHDAAEARRIAGRQLLLKGGGLTTRDAEQ